MGADGYLLAVAAHRFEIQVHAFCVLSNHFHLVVTDPYARLPAFHQFLDALVARAMNASLGRWEAFWAPNSYSAVMLVSPGDILDKAAYVLANPVAAGLVRAARLWPGLWSAEAQAVRDARGGFLGLARVLAQKPTGRPAPGEPRRTLNPRVASRDKWKRIEALGRLMEFLRAYRSAWTARRAGEPDVTFPCGTYLLRIAHGVPCAGFG